MSHFLSSETGMTVALLLRLMNQGGELYVSVRLKGLYTNKDTLELLKSVFGDVSRINRNLLDSESVPVALKARAFAVLSLRMREV